MNKSNKEGKYEGKWQHYYTNGRKYARGYYKNSHRVGYWEAYHSNGKLRRKEYYYI